MNVTRIAIREDNILACTACSGFRIRSNILMTSHVTPFHRKKLIFPIRPPHTNALFFMANQIAPNCLWYCQVIKVLIACEPVVHATIATQNYSEWLKTRVYTEHLWIDPVRSRRAKNSRRSAGDYVFNSSDFNKNMPIIYLRDSYRPFIMRVMIWLHCAQQ